MPAPVRSAPSVPSTAAPGYWEDPVSIPTTPREYLSSPGPGTGQSRARSSSSTTLVQPSAHFGTPSLPPGSTPMSTTSIRPHRSAAGGATWHHLRVAKVTVTSARNEVVTVPELASKPEGRSTASQLAAESCSPSLARSSGMPGRPPIPRTASMTRSGTTWPACSIVTTSHPTRRATCQPAACGVPSTGQTRTWHPSSASSAAASRPSPPLLPPPTSTSTEPPRTPHPRSASMPRACAATCCAATAMRSVPGCASKNFCSAARIAAAVHTY